ncbi:thioesterase family protein [Parahaliea maris]|uniref:Thioesterase family protein n=1 Tax=Parahaliea maris TaxID=2716870 RepID=A0A5C9A4C9_9GAMM|nr:thioesterase family protein [Parahaliea maris]TXS95705.1 thioesterase family protein [Parahaliea maris]
MPALDNTPATATGHPLDAAIALAPIAEGKYRGHVAPSYANFIGPFGGILAAKLLQAVCLDDRRLGDPLALTVNFGGPVADGPFDIHCQPTRTNRSSQHWVMELRQGEDIPLTASAVFAERRDSWADTELQMPEVGGYADCTPLDTGGLPTWVKNYDMRIVSGGMSFLGPEPGPQDNSESILWVRDKPPRPLDFPGLAALSDVFFPRVFVRRPDFVPVGTVSLTTYFHADGEELARHGHDFLLARARGNRFHGGFFDHSGELWSEHGHLLATTHQVVYFKH